MMIGNHLKTAGRMIARHKFYSALNVAGLAVGMATVGLILLWVWDEWRYDRFHARADRICRVTVEDLSGGVVAHQAGSPAPLGQALKVELPEVEDFVRVQAGWSGWQLRIGDRYFMDERLAAVDPSFFTIFSFPFVQGDPQTALTNRHSIVITESLARKAFGKENPMGRVMNMSDTDMTVTGVIRDIPAQSHLCFDYAFPAENMTAWRESRLDAWDYTQFATYLLLRPDARLEAVREKTARLIRSHLPKAQGRVHLQPLSDVHLGSTDINTWMVKYPDKGNIAHVAVFLLTAAGVLLLACVNFMNLSTARHAVRAKEVAVRKVVGAGRRDLFRQFLGETGLQTLIALCLAVVLMELFLPAFNELTGKQLSILGSKDATIWLGLAGIAALTGVLAGSYPALFLSAFPPVQVIRARGGSGDRRGGGLRKALVTLQFVFTISLLIVTAVIFSQLRYMKQKDLGYDSRQVVVFPGWGGFERNWEAARHALLQYPGITSVCQGMPPATGFWGTTEVDWEGRHPGQEVKLAADLGDYDYAAVFRLQMVQGRFYSRDFANDDQNWVVNETAVRAMGLTEPVGKWLSYQGRRGRIIGVVKDYHGASLHEPIGPKVVQCGQGFMVCVRYRTDDVPELMAFLQKQWQVFVRGERFRSDFVDESIAAWYQTEERIQSLFAYFTGLAVLVASLGLLGLAAFMAERRTKEIGVRKVLGASTPGLVLLLVRDQVKWVLAANLIAWPLAWWLSRHWLAGYAYRIDMSWPVFALSGALVLAVAVATVSGQALRAAWSRPVEALRYE